MNDVGGGGGAGGKEFIDLKGNEMMKGIRWGGGGKWIDFKIFVQKKCKGKIIAAIKFLH